MKLNTLESVNSVLNPWNTVVYLMRMRGVSQLAYAHAKGAACSKKGVSKGLRTDVIEAPILQFKLLIW